MLQQFYYRKVPFGPHAFFQDANIEEKWTPGQSQWLLRVVTGYSSSPGWESILPRGVGWGPYLGTLQRWPPCSWHLSSFKVFLVPCLAGEPHSQRCTSSPASWGLVQCRLVIRHLVNAKPTFTSLQEQSDNEEIWSNVDRLRRYMDLG